MRFLSFCLRARRSLSSGPHVVPLRARAMLGAAAVRLFSVARVFHRTAHASVCSGSPVSPRSVLCFLASPLPFVVVTVGCRSPSFRVPPSSFPLAFRCPLFCSFGLSSGPCWFPSACRFRCAPSSLPVACFDPRFCAFSHSMSVLASLSASLSRFSSCPLPCFGGFAFRPLSLWPSGASGPPTLCSCFSLCFLLVPPRFLAVSLVPFSGVSPPSFRPLCASSPLLSPACLLSFDVQAAASVAFACRVAGSALHLSLSGVSLARLFVFSCLPPPPPSSVS